MICILARRGRFLETILQDGARSGVPRTRREPHRRGVRTPTARPLRLGAGSRCGSGAPLPGAGFVGPHPKTATVERRELSRSPRDVGSRVAGATEVESEAVGAPSTPHRGDGIAAVATAAGAKAPVGSPADAKSEGTCEETQKPGRSNAPRERTRLRCLTS